MIEQIIKNSTVKKIRLLIEVEPSGNLHFYCDRSEKRFLIREIRSAGIKDKTTFHIVKPETKFENEKPSIVYLKKDKGDIKHTF